VGKRLSGAQGDPKCLTKINGVSLLERYLRSLEKVNIRDVILVVGYKKEKIMEFVKGTDFRGNIKFIENPDFTQGSILSLNKAGKELDKDVLLMDGDVYFEDTLLNKLIGIGKENMIIIDTTSTSSGEEMMVGVKNGRIMDMQRRLTGDFDTVGEAVGFYKFNRQACRELRKIMAEQLKQKKYELGYENVLPILFQKVHFEPVIIDGMKWVEIDFQEDIVRAEKLAKE
jgi:choline kinase